MKLNRKRIKRKIIGFNFTALFFFLLSCMSFTFAWFAYQNVVKTKIEIGVTAWHIEFKDGVNELSSEVPIKIESFYPGAKKYTKTIEIYNKGDIDAEFSYSISYLRIFDKEFDVENQEKLFDELSHNYPFVFNMINDSEFIKANESIILNITAEWPLDSGDDITDTKWGNEAYKFITLENENALNDSEYEQRAVMEIILELNTKQYVMENEDITDNSFLFGNVYNFDISTLVSCIPGDANCYNFYVIDKNNKIKDETVTFIMDTNESMGSGSYEEVIALSGEKYKVPSAEELLGAISLDIIDSTIVMPNISDRLVGRVSYDNRASMLLEDVATKGGYIKFNSKYFNNLKSDICYWTSTQYNNEMSYAIVDMDEDNVKLYGEEKNSICSFVPIVEINKKNIN